MFFTKVVIDSANVLALVFYNKLTVETTTNGTKTPYETNTTAKSERDISGAMVKAFDPTTLLSQEFFDKAKINYIPGLGQSSDAVPVSMIIGILIMAGIIMLFAAYSFFVTGFYFLARMIELWILIIFSPFAFMSSTLPALSGVTYLGWSAWLKRLIDAAFMAPIFMFFMYFIFLLIQSKIYEGFVGDHGSVFQSMLLIIIPAVMILVLLNQATKFAKKGSGQLGEAVMGAAKLAGGLAIGGTALGLAGLGRGTIGTFMKGASTGDTYAQRKADGEKLGMFGSTMASLQENSGWSKWQKKVGKRLATSEEKAEHASHARHDLDTAAGVVAHGKKWNDLNGEQRKTVKTNMARADAMRSLGFGNKTWNQLDDDQQKEVTKKLRTDNTFAKKVDAKVVEARQKQGLGGIMAQSAVTGSYDIRNIANMVIREQSKGWAKVAMGMTAAVALGLRGGLKNINSGTAQGSVIKDFSNTISEALKNMNVSVDLSHVAAEKKGDDHGHGGGGHH